MKALPLVLLVMGMTSSLAVAQESEVTLTILSGNMQLIRNDFVGPPSTMCLSNLIGGQVPPGSQFIRFDAQRQTYLPAITRDREGSWGPGGTTVLARGAAYWLCIPPQGGLVTNVQYQVTLTGDIPSSSTSMSCVPRYNAVCYPYPVTRAWTNTQFAKICPSGSSMGLWNPLTKVFDVSMRGTRAWSPANTTVLPGQGFFVSFNGAAPTNFTESLPY